MAIPAQPTNFFAQPFAAGGNFSLIPNAPGVSGRASLTSGFPTETQLPLNQGGIAPNRLDFNGILYMLSAFAFWQQSGGQFSYAETLNYTTPCIVYHNGVLWWCLQENGVDSANGVVEPGTDETYWLEFLKALAQMGGASAIGNPVGTVITYWGTTAPDGYFACDGSPFSATTYPKLYALLGSAAVPDLRGYFVRGYDTRANVDPDAPGRGIGSVQNDAIRNIEGAIVNNGSSASNPRNEQAFGETTQGATTITGAFTGVWRDIAPTADGRGGGMSLTGFTFNAANVVPTAAENRPKNVCLLYCIKHD